MASINAQIARRVLDLFARSDVGRDEYGLTGREQDNLRHLVDGESKRQVADAQSISYHTVDTHLKNIYLKLQVHSRAGAVVKVVKERCI